jgi:hypothetical protein
MTDVKNKFLLTLLLLVGPRLACQSLDKTATWIKSKVPDFADNAKPVHGLMSTTQESIEFQSHATVIMTLYSRFLEDVGHVAINHSDWHKAGNPGKTKVLVDSFQKIV